MKKITKTGIFVLLTCMVLTACKKDNKTPAASNSPMTGFWTFQADPNDPNKNWNDNALFKSDGTFRMYTALSLADTAAGPAIADTANQVVTFGTYTVKGTAVKMVFTEFASIGMVCEGSVNSVYNLFSGALKITSDPTSASPPWILIKR